MMTTTERANDVIENIMRRLKACNAKEPHLVKFRMMTRNGITSATATISVSTVGTTNPKYREDICDIIRFAIKGDDVYCQIVQLRSEEYGIVTIDVHYNIGRKIDCPGSAQPFGSAHYKDTTAYNQNEYSNDRLFSNEVDDIRAILKKLGIESTIKTGSNSNNARTGTHIISCVLSLAMPDTFSKTMIKHIPKIVRDEMMANYKDKHVNANILNLHDNIYLYVTVVTKTK